MKVLIVDDSRFLQNRLMDSLLELDDAIVIYRAFNFKEAIEFFSSFEPDIVILDIELPDGSGLDLLRKFKENNPGVKVIIFTNHSTIEFKKSCIDLDASYFIDKSNYLNLINAMISLKYSQV